VKSLPRLGRTRPPRRMRAFVVAAAATIATDRLLALAAPCTDTLERTNFQGRRVSLRGGVATAVGSIAGTLATPSASRGPGVFVGLAAAFAGAYDDLVAPRLELSSDKGWRGHVAAARAGRISGGVVKVVAIGGAAALISGGRHTRFSDRIASIAVISGTANLINLFDLRPGRATKVALALAVPGLAGRSGPLAAAVMGAAIANAPEDLGERTMLGDVGANSLGAVLGARLAALPPRPRMAVAVVVSALSIISERVSFGAVIDSVPILRRIDQAGRTAPSTALTN
jgi:UDP-N-acetylmuramyl pentapeptide phosphotransferase/UDP-N-acetylglucosamine-1-phosphate transferase